MADLPKTWNEAAHFLRADEGPEDFGHEDCAVCEYARTRRGDVGVVEGAAGGLSERITSLVQDAHLWTAKGFADRALPLLMEANNELSALVADREALLERAEKAESEAELWMRRARHAYKLLDGGHGSAVSRGSGGDA